MINLEEPIDLTPIRPTRENVLALVEGEGVRRIHFPTSHGKALVRKEMRRGIGTFSLPFYDSVGEIFYADTELDLFRSNYNTYWRCVEDDDEFNRIEGWIHRQGTRVFIRDYLDLSIALDLNYDMKSGERTELGRFEYEAKHAQDRHAIRELVKRMAAAIRDLPFYRDTPFIAAVPPAPGKAFDLPSILAACLAKALGRQDLTQHFRFVAPKEDIKNLRFDQKWDAWETTGLTFEPPHRQVESVILIDDKYQSGVTLQFVASRLYEAGARKVYGLCVVKTLRNTDNR